MEWELQELKEQIVRLMNEKDALATNAAQQKEATKNQISQLQGMDIVTIEGLSKDGDHPVQKAWLEHDVPQCGYCQSGQIMTAAALLKNNPNPTDEDIDAAMDGNLCRCGTYVRIKQAIKTASKL